MIRIGVLALAAAMHAAPATAQELNPEQRAQAELFALNNSLFFLQHEIGHLMIAEFGLPVLGREEDAADSFATVMFLGENTEAVSQALINSADGWYFSEMSQEGDTWDEAALYDEHGLDIQRSYQVVCMAIGFDPDGYADLANDYQIDPDRRSTCGADYDTAARSWEAVLAPHLSNGRAGAKITVRYEDADAAHADAERVLKHGNFLETAAEALSTNYDLPRPLTFRATMCGEENAFYDYDEAEVVFCYELTKFYLEIIKPELLASTQ